MISLVSSVMHTDSVDFMLFGSCLSVLWHLGISECCIWEV